MCLPFGLVMLYLSYSIVAGLHIYFFILVSYNFGYYIYKFQILIHLNDPDTINSLVKTITNRPRFEEGSIGLTNSATISIPNCKSNI